MLIIGLRRVSLPMGVVSWARLYSQVGPKSQSALRPGATDNGIAAKSVAGHDRSPRQSVQSSHDHSRSPPHSHSHAHGFEHSHSHSHSITGELLASDSPAKNPAVRITLIGFLTNVGMAVGKGVGGVVFHSQSLIADSVHAMSDLVSDIMTLCTVSIARKPPSAYFPNGYGRIETVGAFGVSLMLVMAGASMCWGSLGQIAGAFGIDWIHFGHSHQHTAELADWSAAGIAFASIGIKEALYQATRRVAERENSPVLLANAWHHRVDCLVSAVAVTSITAGQLLQATWVDPLGGFIVSGLIMRAGWSPLVNAVMELCGSSKQAMTSETFEEFQAAAYEKLAAIAPSYEIAAFSFESYGSTFVGTVRLEHIDASAAAVAEQLRQDLLQIKHVRQVYVRI